LWEFSGSWPNSWPIFWPIHFRHGWLKWWQVGLAGLLCGLAFTPLFDSMSPERLDDFGIQDALIFGGIGTLIAIVFWWLGLYRNRAFPAIPRSVPYAMLILIPLAVSGVLVSVIETSLSHDSRPTQILMDQCWHLMNHWSTMHFKRVYSLMAPFGGGVNDC
jgi:hypothetical protein